MPVSHADALREFLLVEMEEGAWSASSERWLRTQRPGGIVFSRLRARSADSNAALVMRIIATLGFVPFLALEEDGGESSLLRDLFVPLPSPRAAARAGGPAVGRLGELIGAGMKLAGFNTNFAPVLDLLTPISEATLGPRAFSSDGHEVARCAEAFIRGLSSHRVMACGKHFPGLSAAQPMARDALPVVGKTMAELWRQDLVPYRELIDKLPLVMLSHCAYKAYDFDVPRPAALSSSVVTGLLRTKLGYAGLAVADLRPSPATGASPDLGDAAAQAMIAGCDILVTAAGGAGKVLAGLRRALELGRLSTERMDQSLERVRAARRRVARPGGRVRKAEVDRLAKRFERFSDECRAEEPKIG
jgi:beta-N-acetylhexosaminidase